MNTGLVLTYGVDVRSMTHIVSFGTTVEPNQLLPVLVVAIMLDGSRRNC